MAQTSTTLIGSTSMVSITARSSISFTASNNRISDSVNGFGSLEVNDIITVSGTTSNNGDKIITAKASDGSYIDVAETIVNESADGSTLSTITQTGVVSTKVAGDGYYSKPDGVHTVAYHISNTVPATAGIKMQGSLATVPTESDWFDISSSVVTPDLSTTAFSTNFTGNFVWVRAKITGVTAGSITSILYNN
jgi:hypothetical protein